MNYHSLVKDGIEIGEHQTYATTYAVKHHYSVNGFKMGWGKTLVGILLSLLTNSKTVVVCPAHLKLNWEKEFKLFSRKKLKIAVRYSKDVKDFTPTDENAIIINYEMLEKSAHIFEWATLVLGDESHALGNPKAQRTGKFDDYIEEYKPHRVLLLSGSPIRGKAKQWYAPLHIVSRNPRKTSGEDVRENFPSYNSFLEEFCNKEINIICGRHVVDFTGLKNEKRLQDLLKGKFLRRIEGFHLDIPPIRHTEIPVNYDENPELEAAWAEFEETGAETKHTSSMKKNNAIDTTPFTSYFAKNILEETGEPIVIFTDHIDSAELLGEKLKKWKYRVKVITGNVDPDTRFKYVEELQKGLLDVIVSTIGAGGSGYNMTKASTLIFNDWSWINTENDQARDRIHRMGQKNLCNIYHMFYGKMAKAIYKVVISKEAVMNKAVNYEEMEELSWV